MGSRYVALIRGINVGRAKRVAMADLRALVETLGYRDPRTLLNSGNIVFDAGRGRPGSIGSRLEKEISVRLGVSARVIVLEAADFTRVVEENTLSERADNPSRLLVAFLADPSDRARLRPLLRQDWTPDALAVGTRAAYLWCPNGILQGRLPEAVGRALGDATTSRNWTTVTRLQALL